MSLCVGICQMDEFGYCLGCGRTQAEIDGLAPDTAPTNLDAPPEAAPPADPDAG